MLSSTSLLHPTITAAIAALSRSGFDNNLSFRRTRLFIQRNQSPLQLEGPMNGMQNALQRPIDLCSRRVEMERHLRRCILRTSGPGNKR